MTSAKDGGRELKVEPRELMDLITAARALHAEWGRSGMGVHVQARAVCDAIEAYDAVLARELGIPAEAGRAQVSFTAFELATLEALLPPLIAVLEAAKMRSVTQLLAEGGR